MTASVTFRSAALLSELTILSSSPSAIYSIPVSLPTFDSTSLSYAFAKLSRPFCSAILLTVFPSLSVAIFTTFLDQPLFHSLTLDISVVGLQLLLIFVHDALQYPLLSTDLHINPQSYVHSKYPDFLHNSL